MGLPFISSISSKSRRRDQVVAVDLGGRTTKAVQIHRRGDKFTLENYGVLDTPIFEKGFSAELLSDHFKNLLRILNSRTKQLTIALGVSETVFRQVEAPLMPIPDLRQMLKYNSKTYLQQDLPDHVFDCQYVLSASRSGMEASNKSAGAAKQKVVVGGVRKQVIDDIQAGCRAAGLFTDHVVPGLAGPVNAFELAEPDTFSKEVIALVELGFKNSTISILDCGELKLNRVVAIGGDRLTSGLAESLGISYQEAENIKLGMPDEVSQNLEPLLHPLGRELRASMDYFENHHDKAVEKVFLSGSSAQSDLIVQALQAELMVPCEVWACTKNLELALPPERMGDIEQVGPQLAVAIGAAVASF